MDRGGGRTNRRARRRSVSPPPLSAPWWGVRGLDDVQPEDRAATSIPRKRVLGVLRLLLAVFALAALFLLVLSAAQGQEHWPKNVTDESLREDTPGPMMRLAAWSHEVGLKLRLSADPIFRAIVCRVPFSNFTLASIAGAIGIHESRLVDVVNELTTVGLIRWSADGSGTVVIEPASEEMRQRMRRWAYEACLNDESCEVE